MKRSSWIVALAIAVLLPACGEDTTTAPPPVGGASPSPSPSPAPSPSAVPPPSPAPSPTPEPSPSPVPSPTPEPTPTPEPLPDIVINIADMAPSDKRVPLVCPPVGLAYLAAAVRVHGHTPHLVDGVGEGLGRFSPFLRGTFTHGLSIDYVRFRVTVDTVSVADAEELKLGAGELTLVLHYTVMGPDAVPIITGRAVSRADRLGYEFDVHPGLHRTDLRPQPAPDP